MFAASANRLFNIIVLTVMMTSGPVLAEATDSRPAKPILLLIGEEQDFTGCTKLGSVTGASQESDNDKPYPQRLIIARTNLQNEAASMGANTIHVLRSNTTRIEVPGVNRQIIFSGEAYYCE
ncbi:MAG: DUF4156 domain-containing protein [Nitrosomonas sp.]|nr:DUF4156 domain-containing protein [Nitrosomonas sp.]MCP5250230.1 DUF4156 domain-containing protein [Burkholderiales bacterium]MDR4519985.1 DUF4156 domain-containing protein [Nitrosomonas sp.]HQU63318.1 DUF4156 domain-containing protein [Nitrosomonas sp.]